ncbi:hypothetical protein ILUMI_17379 [Ignelater luminosus]|uniref:Retrovirus-related Pol polyprotein from transposon TNT 1-94-like beta-barrel domain-containing protein n=1 Tax=Ignelater luminosus TaxID=2038154 RepID=A0A8K0G7C1_IGNLU|nr:hypothetical protein ILUMI_17379 [Ignelater luminosus]
MDEGPINHILTFGHSSRHVAKVIDRVRQKVGGQGLAAYVSSLENIRNQLKQPGEDMSDRMLITKILMTLPNEFAHFASAWESVDENKQTLNELMSLLLIEEERIKSQGVDDKGGAFVVPFLRPFWSRHAGQITSVGYVESLVMKAPFAGTDKIKTQKQNMIMGDQDVKISDDSIIKAEAIGEVRVKAFNGFEWIDTILRNVLYVPTLKKILQTHGMAKCKPANTPMDQNFSYYELQNIEENLKPEDKILLENKYRQVIGSLMYAVTGTRPDLCSAVIILSRYQNCVSTKVWIALKHALRYVKGTPDLSLVYRRIPEAPPICGFVDANWTGNTRD